MKEKHETIAAISSGASGSGIGIVRISGDNAFNIVSRIFTNNSRQVRTAQVREIHCGVITDGTEIIDEVVLLMFHAPHSYTKQNVAEIQCHGGNAPLNKILSLVLSSGARLAEPGEFTKLAFLNGRIDLSRAEAVSDMICAQTESARRAAAAILTGGAEKKINEIGEIVLSALALTEAAADFPDDVFSAESAEVAQKLENALALTNALISSYDTGRVMREGVNTVIVGKPNVGKSSLLNALLNEERAIVTAVPGTTRDVLTEFVTISGVPLKLSDSAGIRETYDEVEKIGIERAIKHACSAELILFVVDGSQPLDEKDIFIQKQIPESTNVITIINKCDLPQIAEIDGIKISTKTGFGLEIISEKIKNMFVSGCVNSGSEVFIKKRHLESLKKTRESLEFSLSTISGKLPLDVAAADLYAAYDFLGEITGRTARADVIDKIFSEFCIGK